MWESCGSATALPVFCLDISDLVASLAGTLGWSSSVLCSICFGAWLPVFVLGLLINNNGVMECKILALFFFF